MLKGKLNNLPVLIRKGDRCNTNIVPSKPVKRSGQNFNLIKVKCEVHYFKEDMTKTSREVFLNGTLQI